MDHGYSYISRQAKTIAFIESDGLGLTFNGIAKGALGLESVLSG